jgi:lycopene cyclase domain-containing protein
MTYLALNITFMLSAFVVLNVVMRKSPWRTLGLTLVVMLAATTIFDNVIIGLHIVSYDPTKVSGVLIGVAPIEDFCYTVVAVMLTGVIFNAMTRKRD